MSAKAIHPKTLRDAKIKSISRIGEDEVEVTMTNGKTHEVYLDELVKDWLVLHNKLQEKNR